MNTDGRGIFVDLAVAWPDSTIEAVEVETEDSDRAIENIRKNIDAGFDTISVLTPNSKVRKGIQKRVKKQVPSEDHKRIQFHPISFYDN